MKIGRLLNVMAANSELLIDKVQKLGIQGFIKYLDEALTGNLLDKGKIVEAAEKEIRWRLAA